MTVRATPTIWPEHATFSIDTNWRLGFIGRNGRGKTTFLRLLLGDYAYQGSIESAVPFSYFPYPVTPEQMKPYRQVTEILVGGFYNIFGKAGDGTLRRDLSEQLLASSVIHIMLAAVTRYAVGLVYVMPGSNPEDELLLLRSALLREFTADEKRN